MRLPSGVMDKQRHIQDLADELLDNILSFLLGPVNEVAGPDAHSSSADFARRSGEHSDLDRFRLVCRKFMRISTPIKFRHFALRFSRDGFAKLEGLLDWQLACHVRSFTYMVRPFYQGTDWARVLNRASANNFLFAQKHISRFQDQNFLVDRSLDEISLRRAIPAFASLQQVKLLRLQDREDEQMQKYIRRRNQEHNVCLDWEPACTRAVANLSMSLLDSNSFIRFIAPQVCPEAALNLIHAPASTIAAVGNRLASLDLNFHSTTEVTSAMRTLSPIFRIFFPATTDTLSALHLGFSSRLPAEIPLEQIFHRIHWRKLRTLSLQSWNLHLDDLTGLLHRHRRQLRDLRLVNILLRDGKWVDVLSVLRDELDRLDRLELRDIDYSSRLSANGNGDTPPTTIPSRDLPTPDPAPMPQDLLSFARKPTPPRRLPDGAMSWDELRGLSPDQLGDDGVVVKRERIPLWEAWALCRPRYF